MDIVFWIQKNPSVYVNPVNIVLYGGHTKNQIFFRVIWKATSCNKERRCKIKEL